MQAREWDRRSALATETHHGGLIARVLSRRFRRVPRTVKQLLEKGGRPSVGVDDADLAADDIDKLRQRFDACESKGLAERGWFAIPEREIAIRIVSDSPEFQHLETTAGETDAALSDQNGAHEVSDPVCVKKETIAKDVHDIEG
jgi:hypothetical protein